MTAKIKLNAASGGGSISIKAPSSSSNNRVIALPDIADGTLLTSQSSLDSTKLSPAISAGIAMADQWRPYNTQSIGSNTTATITSWERNDNTFAGIGSAMNESSGVFTFPSTGIYLVIYNLSFWNESGNCRYISGRLNYNGNLMSTPFCHINHISTETFGNVGSNVMLDVTNTSHQLTFTAVSNSAFNVVGNNWAGVGNASVNSGDVTFLRLGDT